MDDTSSSISVAVRVRPLTEKEQLQIRQPCASENLFHSDASLCSTPVTQKSLANAHRSSASGLRKIVRVVDDRVLVFDPPESNPVTNFQRQILGPAAKKVKDIRFCFDKVYDQDASQADVYGGSGSELINSVLSGYNGTAFAYGATGCGKTHTISGTPTDPGIVFMLMKDLFATVASKSEEIVAEITVSYLEIYNETIRDLLHSEEGPSSPLNLREVEGRVTVPGLSSHTPTSPENVIQMIHQGNCNRQTSPTEANATSSRSHAVLSVNVKHRPRTADISEDYTVATLSVIDLAGSERAAVTKNRGDRLWEGANINRSLLALGNCINALCDPRKRNHIPYRDSKLTRLLKHSLGGNCKTVMIVCISPSSQHYDETHNTLQYANRAKEIKTKVTRNVVSVDRHVSQYVRIIYELRQELESRKKTDGSRDVRIKDDFYNDIQRGFREADMLLRRVRATFADLTDQSCQAISAYTQTKLFHQMQQALEGWISSVNYLPGSEAECEKIELEVKNLQQCCERLFVGNMGEEAKNTRDACLQSCRSTLQAKFPDSTGNNISSLVLSHFDQGAQVISSDFERKLTAVANKSWLDGSSRQHFILNVIQQALARVASTSPNSIETLLKANEVVFNNFSALHLDGVNNHLPNISTLDLGGHRKRTISGDEATTNSGPVRKVRRSSVFSNVKTSPTVPTSVRSPKRTPRASALKARPRMSPRKRLLLQKSDDKELKKSVAWRDQQGGQQLEDFHNQSDLSGVSASTSADSSLNNSKQLSSGGQGIDKGNISTDSSNGSESPQFNFTLLTKPKRDGVASKPTKLQSLGEEMEVEDDSSLELTKQKAPYPGNFTSEAQRKPLTERHNEQSDKPFPGSSNKSNSFLTPKRASAAAAARARKRMSSIGPVWSAKAGRRHSSFSGPQSRVSNGQNPNDSSSNNPKAATIESGAGRSVSAGNARRDSNIDTTSVVRRPVPRARRESSFNPSTVQPSYHAGTLNNSLDESRRSDTSFDKFSAKPVWK